MLDLTLSNRASIQRLEAEMLKLPQVEIPVTTLHFGDSDARMIVVKAGTTLTGAIHLTEHINFVCGDISVFTEEGDRRITGSEMFVSKPGMKRAGHAHADTFWLCIMKTELTDADENMAALTTNDYADPRLIALQEHLKLEGK